MGKLILILGLSTFIWSQDIDNLIVSGKTKIAEAVKDFDASKMLASRAYFERALTLKQKEWLIHFYIAYCNENLVNYWMSKGDKDKAKTYINDGIDHLESSIENNPNFGESLAMLSSLYGRKIAVMPWATMYYGPKSGKLSEKAILLSPKNPRVHLTMGVSTYHTPSTFGGGAENAKPYLLNAITYFESESPEAIMPDWGHSDVYAWLGIMAHEAGEIDQAREYYEKALSIDPNNTRVSQNLLPDLKK